MISRRSFLSLLAAVPFVGKFVQHRPYSLTPMVYDVAAPSETSILVTAGGKAFWFDPSVEALQNFPTLAKFPNHDDYLRAFAEWDRKYQG